ncbi:hypothetical protein [Nonomuraea sp. NPDC003804]|uniref:hypothetical protein n=1 Tax=Nonomuraea sp. NPDC003804 TaxID=3154547 RepID=UPI0033A7ABD6
MPIWEPSAATVFPSPQTPATSSCEAGDRLGHRYDFGDCWEKSMLMRQCSG